jgi:L-lactate dehydrogenase complex protein LldF
MCNQCGVVCPVKIPLPDLQRKLREQELERGMPPWRERAGLRLWSFVAQRPRLYAFAARLGARMLRRRADRRGMIRALPWSAGWTEGRDLPAPSGRTFRELYAARAPRAGSATASATVPESHA